jgi:hypothetical protein
VLPELTRSTVWTSWLELLAEVEQAAHAGLRNIQLGATLADFEVLLTGGGSCSRGWSLQRTSEPRFKPGGRTESPDEDALICSCLWHRAARVRPGRASTPLLPPEFGGSAESADPLHPSSGGSLLLVITALVLAVEPGKTVLISRKEALLTHGRVR